MKSLFCLILLRTFYILLLSIIFIHCPFFILLIFWTLRYFDFFLRTNFILKNWNFLTTSNLLSFIFKWPFLFTVCFLCLDCWWIDICDLFSLVLFRHQWISEVCLSFWPDSTVFWFNFVSIFWVIWGGWIGNERRIVVDFSSLCRFFVLIIDGLIGGFDVFLRIFLILIELSFWLIVNLLFKRQVLIFVIFCWKFGLFTGLLGCLAYECGAIREIFLFVINWGFWVSFRNFTVDKNARIIADWFFYRMQWRLWCFFNLKVLKVESLDLLIVFIVDVDFVVFVKLSK